MNDSHYLALVLMAFAGTTAGQSGQAPPESFAVAKAQQLERLRAEEACVEAATSFEALQACRPRPPGNPPGPPSGGNHP
jgi:hypothetical protein